MSGVPAGKRYVQFITHYQHANGRARVRVTTTAGPWQSDPSNIKSIAHSFDQQAAAVCLARVAIHRIETEAPLDVLRFIDRSLIRFCAQFAQYRKNDPASFQLAPEFALFPQFLFHLRRSPFMQIFNSSPDEVRAPAAGVGKHGRSR
jgi:protein transport protein SEC23